MRKTMSGFNVTTGMPGIKLITKPASTKKMGYGTFSFSLSIDSIDTAIKRVTISSKFS